MASSNVIKKEPKLKENSKARLSAIKDMIDNEECVLRKRLPRKLPKRDCDVYVSNRTNYKQQLERCQKILDNGNLVCIHGLGIAINRAINLANQLKSNGTGTVEVAAHTSTVELTDDIEPLKDDRDAETVSRNNSAIHIRVFRPDGESASKQLAKIEKHLKK
ncbi:ribonuclease P protein subunit p20-like [Ruditapes philippinarum]|uniref:ribonuclease P protein subunit p20-like n=1 Tax=Ruditapes philippinarum TaxID=129788 RepID=UPI00295B1599|nr:ribonuclease P protein subunit p20-like [Ruditapes philippinarum]